MFSIIFLITGLAGWVYIGVTRQYNTTFIRNPQPRKNWLWLIAIICLLSIANNALEYPFINQKSSSATHPNHRLNLVKEWEQGNKAEANTNSNISLATPFLFEVWIYTKDIYRLIGFFMANALEEFGRFGILLLFLFLRKRFSFQLFVFAQIFIAVWFSLCHDYINTLPGPTFISAHTFAFAVSLVFVEIGIRYGVLAAYYCHVAVNFFDFNILLHTSSIFLWLNVLIGIVAIISCFYILRKTPLNLAWFKSYNVKPVSLSSLKWSRQST